MADQAIAEQKQGPHGTIDSVPGRSGVQSDQPVPILSRPQQDAFTEDRRAHYGEDPVVVPGSGGGKDIVAGNVNDVDTPNNPIMRRQIYDPMTSYGRAMVA